MTESVFTNASCFQLCFAYNGPIDPKVRIEYNYRDGTDNKDGKTTFDLNITPTSQYVNSCYLHTVYREFFAWV